MAGIFGVALNKDCFEELKRGTSHLQPTRGDKHVGVSFLTHGRIENEKGDDGEPVEAIIQKILGKDQGQEIREAQIAIGGVDYHERQALRIDDSRFGPFSLVGDVKIINRDELAKEYPYLVGSDLRVCAGLIAAGKDPVDGLEIILNKVLGRFNLGLLTLDGLFACRDRWGFRSLALARNEQGCWGFSSESAALGAAFEESKKEIVREVYPAEIVEIKSTGIKTWKQLASNGLVICTFDLVYGQEPASIFEDIPIWLSRFLVGRFLTKEYGVNTEIVFSWPLSGISAAQGVAFESGVPLVDIWQYNLKGRSYMPTSEKERRGRGRDKYSAIEEVIRQFSSFTGVDDSIVEGNQLQSRLFLLNRLVKKYHPLEEKPNIDMLIASPPKVNACPLEVPFRPKEKLFAASRDNGKMAEDLQLRRLRQPPIDKFVEAQLSAQSEERKAVSPLTKKNLCLCCFDTGKDVMQYFR